ncbi:unnamed protein product [Moneuplotes crassus]|uniref:Uncharacterized protein n=1 Tax=Euplotes crassus TaxID=5936 RepID=A0AAD1XGR7_EUPCR|nr:unnamed protein product [Moneuplotes crassus]
MLLLGLIFGVLSSCFDALGFVIQKKGHILAAEKGIKYLKHPIWILGMVTQILANPFLLVALNLSSQSALSFIPALAIINIVIWSRVILGVKVTKYDLYALCFMIPGIALIITSSRVRKIDLLSWQVGDYLFSTQTIIYLCITLALFIGFGLLTYKMLVKFNLLKKDSLRDSQASGEDEQVQRNKPDILEQPNILIPLIFLPFYAGFTATFSNTVAKLNMNVLHDDVFNHQDGDPKLGVYKTTLLILFNFMLIYSNLFLLNKCIQYFEPIYIIPMKKVALLINNILCGGIILDEFSEFNNYMVTGVICGAFLCTVGVSFFILKRLKHIKKLRLKDLIKQTELGRLPDHSPKPDLSLEKPHV